METVGADAVVPPRRSWREPLRVWRAGRRPRVWIGAGVRLGRGVALRAGRGARLVIGDGVAIGQHVLFTTNSHASGHPLRRAGALVAEPIRIGHGAWIAARAVLLPGVTVGDGAIVTAGAVVTRSIPAHTMAGGVPARPIKELPAEAEDLRRDDR